MAYQVEAAERRPVVQGRGFAHPRSKVTWIRSHTRAIGDFSQSLSLSTKSQTLKGNKKESHMVTTRLKELKGE